jgi:hypothetical protein
MERVGDGRPRMRPAIACWLAIVLLALNLGQALAAHAGEAARHSHAVSAPHARGAPATVRTAPDIGAALPSVAAFDVRLTTTPRTAADVGRTAPLSRATPRETLPRSPPALSPIA